MQTTPRLSIVLPIYNVAPYLARGLDSILDQGLKRGEYEVLLIDDGSTDNSLDICQSYAQQYPDIFNVISKSNEGVSATRNLGIDKATGQYIYFMDPDDYLLPGSLGRIMRNYLDDGVDILQFGYQRIQENAQPTLPTEASHIVYDGWSLVQPSGFIHSANAWTKIINREFLRKHNIRFKKMYLVEDGLFALYCFAKNCHYRTISDCIYCYVDRGDSAMKIRNKAKMREAIPCYIRYFAFIKYLLRTYDNSPELVSLLRSFYANPMVGFFSRTLFADLSYKEFKTLTQKTERYLRLAPSTTPCKVIAFLYKYPSLYLLASPIFRHRHRIMPFLEPLLKRKLGT